MDKTNSRSGFERNQKIVSLGIAELGMSSILFLLGGIFILLKLFHIHTPKIPTTVPVIGFFLSIGWILVSWQLLQSSDKSRDIRQRRRFVLYWTIFSALIAIFNVSAIIWFIVIIFKKGHAYTSLILSIIILIVILLVRGFIFFTVFHFSKDLLKESSESNNQSKRQSMEPETQNSLFPEEKPETENIDEDQPEFDIDIRRSVIVTAV